MRILLTILIILSFQFCKGQTASAATERIIKIVPRSVPKYAAREKANVYLLQTGFNDAVFQNTSLLKQLGGKTIVKAELVYTTYRKSETFDQHSLNRKRLKSLFAAAPNSLTQPSIEWVLIAQTGCTSAEMGKEFFHGIVITVREESGNELTNAEVSYLNEVLKGTVSVQSYDKYIANSLKAADSASVSAEIKPRGKIDLPQFAGGERARTDYFTKHLKSPNNVGKAPGELVPVQFKIDKNGKVSSIVVGNKDGGSPYQQAVKEFVANFPDWTPAKEDGKPIDCVVRFKVHFTGDDRVIPGPLEIFDGTPPPVIEKAEDLKNIPVSRAYSTVSEALVKINPHNCALVCDVTASMVPYNAQTLLWLQEKLKNKTSAVKRVVFFNDGNNRGDAGKKTGSVGGIYSFIPKSIEETVKEMSGAMKNGSGGDLVENDIEALIKAQVDCPDCESLLLLADNLASPRDMSLLPQVTKPVIVIVCSQSPSLNPVWLDVASYTKGSISFMGKIIDLSSIDEGGTVAAGRNTYKRIEGKFIAQ